MAARIDQSGEGLLPQSGILPFQGFGHAVVLAGAGLPAFRKCFGLGQALLESLPVGSGLLQHSLGDGQLPVEMQGRGLPLGSALLPRGHGLSGPAVPQDALERASGFGKVLLASLALLADQVASKKLYANKSLTTPGFDPPPSGWTPLIRS